MPNDEKMSYISRQRFRFIFCCFRNCIRERMRRRQRRLRSLDLERVACPCWLRIVWEITCRPSAPGCRRAGTEDSCPGRLSRSTKSSRLASSSLQRLSFATTFLLSTNSFKPLSTFKTSPPPFYDNLPSSNLLVLRDSGTPATAISILVPATPLPPSLESSSTHC